MSGAAAALAASRAASAAAAAREGAAAAAAELAGTAAGDALREWSARLAAGGDPDLAGGGEPNLVGRGDPNLVGGGNPNLGGGVKPDEATRPEPEVAAFDAAATEAAGGLLGAGEAVQTLTAAVAAAEQAAALGADRVEVSPDGRARWVFVLGLRLG